MSLRFSGIVKETIVRAGTIVSLWVIICLILLHLYQNFLKDVVVILVIYLLNIKKHMTLKQFMFVDKKEFNHMHGL